MTTDMRDDREPTRLHAVSPAAYDEPPYDPYYDAPPPAARETSRKVPADIPAEQAVLGALLIAPELAPQLQPQLKGNDFYRPAHEELWDTIHQLSTDGTTVDMVVLTSHLMATGDLKRLGGAEYLHTLIAACPIPSNAEHYATTVREAAKLRAVQAAGTRLLQIAADHDIAAADTAYDAAVEALDEHFSWFGTTPTAATTTGLADLSWILTGTPPEMPAPTYTHRTDGIALFYPAKVNGIFGDPEAAKTWLAQTAVVEALTAGGTAAMIDVDHNGPDHTAARLLLFGAHPQHLADPERFRYYEPHERDELLAAVDDIARRHIDVVVVDSIGEVFPMLGISTNDGDEMTTALRRTCTVLANAGSCVITIDHLPKSTDARQTGFAIGTIAKKRMIRGSYIRAEARTQPAPGQIGRITLRIEKDPAGGLRKHTPGGYAGTFILDSTHSETDGVTTWRIEREEAPKNDDGTFRPTHLMEKVSRFVEQNDQCSKNAIEKAKLGKAEHIRGALQILLDEGFITPIPGRAGHPVYHSIAMYRKDEDDLA